MKSTIISLTLASVAIAAPTTYAAPPGGWESVDYSNVDYSGVDWNKVDYSKVDYGKIDWTKVNYPPGTGAVAQPDTDNKDTGDKKPDCAPQQFFTSTWKVESVPEQVVNASGPTGGLSGSHATFWLGINSKANLICYDITSTGFRGNYQSPAVTATHIHEGGSGAAGPPRIAFPDPQGDGDVRRSTGCMQGPFKTGVVNNGADAGDGFHVSQIEKDPAKYYVDIHSSLAVPGANRGQFK